MEIRELQNLLNNRDFNPYIDISNSDRVLIHLIEEIGELVKIHRKGIHNNENIKNMSFELGDVLILLVFYASSKNFDLEQSLINKLRYNIQTKRFIPTEKEMVKLFEEKSDL